LGVTAGGHNRMPRKNATAGRLMAQSPARRPVDGKKPQKRFQGHFYSFYRVLSYMVQLQPDFDFVFAECFQSKPPKAFPSRARKYLWP